MVTETKEVQNGLADLTGPGSIVAEYRAKKRDANRGQFRPLPIEQRFTIGIVAFCADGSSWTAIQWKPTHPLQVPSKRLLEDSNTSDEISYSKGEKLFYTRAEVLAEVAEFNGIVLQMLADGHTDRQLIWNVAIELGDLGDCTFGSCEWDCGMFSITNIRCRLVKWTAAEVAKYAGKAVRT